MQQLPASYAGPLGRHHTAAASCHCSAPTMAAPCVLQLHCGTLSTPGARVRGAFKYTMPKLAVPPALHPCLNLYVGCGSGASATGTPGTHRQLPFVCDVCDYSDKNFKHRLALKGQHMKAPTAGVTCSRSANCGHSSCSRSYTCMQRPWNTLLHTTNATSLSVVLKVEPDLTV